MAGVWAAGRTLTGACSEVCSNPLLHLILKIALIMGNFLNAGAPQVGACQCLCYFTGMNKKGSQGGMEQGSYK